MKLQINITKEILQRSMYCGTESYVGKNCAIALAVRDIFPHAWIYGNSIDPLYFMWVTIEDIPLPKIAIDFIVDFDFLKNNPQERLSLPTFSFEIEVPEEVIDKLGNLDEVYKIIENSETLNLVL